MKKDLGQKTEQAPKKKKGRTATILRYVFLILFMLGLVALFIIGFFRS